MLKRQSLGLLMIVWTLAVVAAPMTARADDEKIGASLSSEPKTAQTQEPQDVGTPAPVEATIDVPSLPEPPAPVIRKVDAISIHFKGNSPVSEGSVRSHIELKAGDTFTQAALDRSIKALFATGYFENVYATPEEPEKGKIALTFELTGKMRIHSINFEGNRHIKSKKLSAESGLKANELVGSADLAAASRKIKDYYGKKSFPNINIVTRQTSIDTAGLVDLTFVVDEGKKEVIKAVNFVGNTHAKADALRKVLATKKSTMWSFFTGSGRVEDDNLTDDLTNLGQYYRDHGYLEVKVSGPQITPKGTGVVLTYTIVEGTCFKIGTQSITGNTLFDQKHLSKAFAQSSGQPISVSAIDQTTKSLRDIYGAKGYLETVVNSDFATSSTPGILDVKYTVKEGKLISVGTINIEGNTTTKNIVVARELLLAPGDVFSATKMRTSEARLQNTGYFSADKEQKVKLTDTPAASGNDSQRDLNVAVTEGKTGNVTFGAGFGSLDGAMFFGEFSQGNFDISNPKSFFRGGGQKLRLYASVGTQSSQALLSFEEPWLFQQRLAAGFSLYRTANNYLSDEYSEHRTGMEVYLRKRLIELVDGRLSYRIERVIQSDVSSTISPELLSELGNNTISKVSLNLTRDTRDKVMFSTSGSRWELDNMLASDALGGGVNYWALEARGAKYLHSFEWPTPQYITLLGRVGTMDGFNGDEVPLSEKFFLGGPNTLRGFNYRKVGPLDINGEALGGNTYGFWSFEYAFQLGDPIQLAAFYDGGFVNSGTANFSTARYNDDIGLGVRVMVMGAPMRLDFAVPVTADAKNDNSGRFWFSFGTRF